MLSTLAANRTHALLGAHDGVVSSLRGGYHLAYAVGALSVAMGAVLAIALLRRPADGEAVRAESAPAPEAPAVDLAGVGMDHAEYVSA